MNDVVSFETALRLKEAGFPQPEPHYRQVWYDERGEDLLFEVSAEYFAPTATNILRQIRQELDAATSNAHYWVNLSPMGTIWEVVIRLSGGCAAHGFTHENPAEAAALAYEWVKKQKNI